MTVFVDKDYLVNDGIFCTSVFLTISDVTYSAISPLAVGTFHAAPRHARKAAAAARRRAELPESAAAAARPFCRRRRRGATGLGLYCGYTVVPKDERTC